MLSLILTSLLFSMPGPASEDGICRDIFQQHGTYSYSRQAFAPDACFLTVKPTDTPEMLYRSFIFRETGKLMIFNSYSDGPSETETGARVYYFFPRQNIPSFALLESSVQVASSSPLKMSFDASNGSLVGFQNAVISIDPKIHDGNRGGVEISSYAGLMLDAGFALGSDPSARPESNSTFTDIDQRTCIVKNKEIFSVDDSGESTFKFTDQRLTKFLNQRCPGLKFR